MNEDICQMAHELIKKWSWTYLDDADMLIIHGSVSTDWSVNTS